MDSRRPVRLGAMIGLVSLPRPIDAEVFVRIVDLFGIGLGYSDFPAFIANPLLDLAGAKSDSTTRNRVDNLADLGSSYPLPSLHLRLGWML